MKRSDMVHKLIQAVYDATDCSTKLSKEEASLTLFFIEKSGMLPPVSEETTKQHNQSTIDAMFDSITYDFKWDLEE